MKRLPPHRYVAVLALGCVLLPGTGHLSAQEEGSPVSVLLGRARTLEQRGRLDLAKQDWAEVLALDPNDPEALAGLVRAARAEGKTAEAAQYLARFRASHPNDPELAKLGSGGGGSTGAQDLAEAQQLAQAGKNREAFAIYRRVYGMTPPAGAPALAYFQSEAATEEGRPHAIAGLRALADRYPQDNRYAIALGRILLGSARTRSEGRTLLERFPGNPEAEGALRSGSGEGLSASNASQSAAPKPEAGSVSSSPQQNTGHPTAEATAKPLPKPSPAVPFAAASSSAHTPAASSAPTLSRVSTTREPRHQSFPAEEQAGFAALNQHRAADAEQIFRGILAKDANNPRALAGLGYLRVTAGDLKAAVLLFEQAQESGDRSLALTRALVNAQFELSLRQAQAARSRGDLPGAEAQYRSALRERNSDPEALEGLATVLLQSGRAEEAIPVYKRLTEVRPMSPAAWRGLVISQASAGRGEGALATDAKVPADVKPPLQSDSSYLQALTTARGGSGTSQVARVEAPPLRPPPPPPPPAAASVPTTPRLLPPSHNNAPAPSSGGSTHVAPSSPASPPPPAASVATAPRPSTAAHDNAPAPTAGAPTHAAVSAPPPSPSVSSVPAAKPLAPPSPLPTPPTLPASSPAPTKAAVAPPSTPAPVPAPPVSAQPAPAPVARVSAPAHRGSERRRGASTSAGASAVAAKPAAPAPAPATPVASPGATLANAKEAIAAERTTQAEAALRSGDSARAAGLFRDAIAEAPNRPEIWKGLIQALHESGRNEQAVEQWAQVPDVPRAVLERDASFQLAVGGVLLAADRPDEALRAFVRAQDVFASQRLLPPLELVLRVATLLAARGDDGNLYRELMYLGDRSDLNDAQRRNVQMIWTSWAVRRGRALAAAGDGRRAVTILNAAAEAFSGNPEVVAAVAEGYAGAGLPREAVALLKARDLSTAPARELQTAISAGIAAREYRAAEGWARLGKQRFPKDPEMLTAIAELEQARGHQGRAEELSQQAKALALPQDPAQVLTAELREAKAGIGVRSAPGGQLAVLLAPSEATTLSAPSQAGRPFLPASGPGTGKAAEVAPVLSGYEPLQREPGSL